MAENLPAWTSVALPHDDVREGDPVKAEYAVSLARIERASGEIGKTYADPRAFFQATYLTNDLRRILVEVMEALSGKKTDRVIQLRTPFGGGKSHSLLALYHLATGRMKLAGVPELGSVPDPGKVCVAVLPCADLTPGIPRRIPGGPTLRTLWGELAFRLGGAEAYEVVRPIDETLSAPGGDVVERLLRRSKDESTLLLADEVLVYVERAMAVPAGESSLARQAQAFLQALTETVASLPRAAFVYSLQASVAEAMGDEGLLRSLEHLVARVDARRVPVQDREIREIIRRRLFESLGDEASRRRVAGAYAEEYRRFLEGSAETDAERERVAEDVRRFEEEVYGSYPFHPSLIRLMYERWGSLPSYQRTRGALQFLGTVVHVLFKRGSSAPLIAPGDVPLDQMDVRSEFFRQVGEREKWDSVLDADVANERARSTRVDRKIGDASPALLQRRVGTSLATAITLYSFGNRKDEMRGVTRGDLLASSISPGLEAPVLDSALGELRESLLYLHQASGRFRMDTIPGLNRLIDEAVGAVEGEDVVKKIRDALGSLLHDPRTALLWPESAGKIPDERREFAIAYLGLEVAESSPERTEALARELLTSCGPGEKSGKRRFKNALAFAVPGKQDADRARGLARRVLALDKLRQRVKTKLIAVSEEQKDELDEKAKTAGKDFSAACRDLYGQILLPVKSKDGGERIGFRSVDLGTLAAMGAECLHAQIFDLLRKQVFTEILPDRFVEILRLGAEGPSAIRLGDVLDEFFAILDRPKMRSDGPLLGAIAEAVAAGLLGYASGGRVEDGAFIAAPGGRVCLGTAHDPDEFDNDEGYLLAPELARRLAPPRPPAVEAGQHEPEEMPEARPLPPPVRPGARGTRFDLVATARRREDWHRLGKAVFEIVGKASEVEVKIEVIARQPAGFDSVSLRNQVQEPLEEAEIQHRAVLSDDGL